MTTGLDIIVAMHEKNGCYISNTPATMGGIIVHSTGANNPYLKRYVDAPTLVGVNTNNNTWNNPSDKMGYSACVHAFIGYDINNVLRVAQILPYNNACWGNGGASGNCNYNPNARIQFEIQEDTTNDKAFLDKQLAISTQYCAELCIMFGWNPLGTYNGAPVIMDHAESCAYKKGSNHADVSHWLKKHGYNMDWFRNEVKNKMEQLKGVTIGKTTVVRAGRGTGVPSKYANTGVVEGGTIIPPKPPTTTNPVVGNFKVGDIVTFKGGSHYASANATNPAAKMKAGKAKVTNTYNGKHQYHLIGTLGGAGTGNSNVYGWVDAVDIEGISIPTPTPTPSPAPVPTNTVVVGDIVNFGGGAHYVNPTATSHSGIMKAGKAKVTNINSGTNHPYHLIGAQGNAGSGNSNVYGWVDSGLVSKQNTTPTPVATVNTGPIVKGDKVKVKVGAKSYTGGGIQASIMDYTWYVLQVNGNRAVINDSVCGRRKGVMTPIRTEDLIRV